MPGVRRERERRKPCRFSNGSLGGEAGDRVAGRGGSGESVGGGNGRAHAHLGDLRTDEGLPLSKLNQGPIRMRSTGLARRLPVRGRARARRVTRGEPPGDDGDCRRPFASHAWDDATGDVRDGEPRPSNLTVPRAPPAIFFENGPTSNNGNAAVG